MFNIQKYKDEIIEETKELSLGCAAAKLAGFNCSDRKCSECRKKTMDWLLEEYKEPILNDEEKKILNQLIVANSVISNKKLVYVQKVPVSKYSNKSFLLFRFEDSNCVYTVRFNTDCIFKRMEGGKRYILEELGL